MHKNSEAQRSRDNSLSISLIVAALLPSQLIRIGLDEHHSQIAMGVCGCRVPNTDIPNLVAVGRMRRRMRLELWEGRGLVNHMASILGRFYQGISLKSPVTENAP
jgi:hypothetical protein